MTSQSSRVTGVSALSERGAQARAVSSAAQAITTLIRVNARLELSFLARRYELAGQPDRAARCRQLRDDPDAFPADMGFPRPLGAR